MSEYRYLNRETWAGIPLLMQSIDKACAPFAIMRMFPFADEKKVREEFADLKYANSGIGKRQFRELLRRVGVLDYVKEVTYFGKRPSMEDISYMGVRGMFASKDHITMVREDGIILDTQILKPSTKIRVGFLLRPEYRNKVFSRIRVWRKEREDWLKWMIKKQRSALTQASNRLAASGKGISPQQRGKLRAKCRESRELLNMALEEAGSLAHTAGF